jgi:transposase
LQAAELNFADSSGSLYVCAFFGPPGTHSKPRWQGKLVTDDVSGQKACFESGVTDVG